MVVLGSTGSIGQNSLRLIEKFGIGVEGLVAGQNWRLLARQIEQFGPRLVAVGSREVAEKLTSLHLSHRFKLFWGEEGILELLEESQSKQVINGLVGESGVRPTLKAVELGKEVGLANKESLVVAGQFIDTSKIFPIDSEHFAIWELIKGRRDEVVKIVITASGGAVRTLPLSHFSRLTPEEVLDHPNWEMGAKITIDSSTMVNKLFELLEAYWLFKIPNLEGVIEPTSTLHGLIELKDGGVMAHLSRPDMALPIAHFLKRDGVERVIPSLPLVGLQLQLLPIEEERYPVWKIAPLLLRQPQLGVVVNTINDRMVELFLNRKLPFPAIATTILEGVERFEGAEVNSLSQLWELKREVERWLDKRIKGGRWSGV